MASGSFSSSVYNVSTYTKRYIEVIWSSTNSYSDNNNGSTIEWTAYWRGSNKSGTSWVYAKNCKLSFDGGTSWITLIGSTSQKAYIDSKISSGRFAVTHNTDGRKTVNVAIQGMVYESAYNTTYTGQIQMTNNPVYSLSISADSNSTVSVTRTLCTGIGSTGTMTAGTKKLCYGDKIKVTFGTSENYELVTHKVNNTTFTSGGSHTVSGNVTVTATAQPLASTIKASDANIGAQSTITINKYYSGYYHSIRYEFGNSPSVSGYITSSGGTSSTEVKFSNTILNFTVPVSFYSKIAGSKSGTCTLTCKTYKSETGALLGSSTTTFKATVDEDINKPVVTGTVTLDDDYTENITGSADRLIRYKSKVVCTIDAQSQNSSTLASIKINGLSLSFTAGTTAEETFIIEGNKLTSGTFTFEATDSRGLKTSVTVNRDIVNYVPLTLNAEVSRPSPVSGEVTAKLSGNYYSDTFNSAGTNNNTLTIQYKYSSDGIIYYPTDSWIVIPSSSYTISGGKFTASVDLEDANGSTTGFDYNNKYYFRMQAVDGPSGYTLTTVTTNTQVEKGTPPFYFDDQDFVFTIPIKYPSVVRKDITVSPALTDLNDIQHFGHYRCTSNADATTLHDNGCHCPTKHAFIMDVYPGTGRYDQDGPPVSSDWRYFIQQITTYRGVRYIRRITYNGSSTPEFSEWHCDTQTLLWENPDTTAAFASPTTVNVEGTYFSSYMIMFKRRNTSTSYYSTLYIPIESISSMCSSILSGQLIARWISSATSSYITFGSGAVYSTYGTETTDDSYMIPVKIYGIP